MPDAVKNEPTLAPGTKLGPYEVVSLLGAGGMGEVYRARDARLGRDVAVKILPADVLDAEASGRFEREVRAVAALSHPNILADSAGRPVLTQGVSSPPSVVGALAWSHDGKQLAVGGAPGAQPAVWIVDVSTGSYRRVVKSAFYSILAGLEWSVDDGSLVVGRVDYDTHVLLLDGI